MLFISLNKVVCEQSIGERMAEPAIEVPLSQAAAKFGLPPSTASHTRCAYFSIGVYTAVHDGKPSGARQPIHVVVAREPTAAVCKELLTGWLLLREPSQSGHTLVGLDTIADEDGAIRVVTLYHNEKALVLHVPRVTSALLNLEALLVNGAGGGGADEATRLPSAIFTGVCLAGKAAALGAETGSVLLHGGLDVPADSDRCVSLLRANGQGPGSDSVALEGGGSEWTSSAGLSLEQVRFCVVRAWAGYQGGIAAAEALQAKGELSPSRLFTLHGLGEGALSVLSQLHADASSLKAARLAQVGADSDEDAVVQSIENAAGWVGSAARSHSIAAAAVAGYPAAVLPELTAPSAARRSPLGLRLGLTLLDTHGDYEDNDLPPSQQAQPDQGHGSTDDGEGGDAEALVDESLRALETLVETRQRSKGGVQCGLEALSIAASSGTLADVLAGPAQRIVSRYLKGLNTWQRLALLTAHAQRVTVISGGPSTGKTSVLAALCGSFTAQAERVIVITPTAQSALAAFAALRRPALAAGAPSANGDEDDDEADGNEDGHDSASKSGWRRHDDVALFSRRDDYAPWVDFGLLSRDDLPFVVSDSEFGSGSSNSRRGRWTGHGSHHHSSQQQRPAIVVMSIADFAAASLPSSHVDKDALIAAAAAAATSNFAAASSGDGDESGSASSTSSWPSLIRSLAHFKSISSVLVDDASQVWEGHLLPITSEATLPSACRLVVLGDPHGLPPASAVIGAETSAVASSTGGSSLRHGTSDTTSVPVPDVSGIPSLLASLTSHPALPVVPLSAAYNLPPEVGSILSQRMYSGDLHMQSAVASSAKDSADAAAANKAFRTALARGLFKLDTLPVAAATYAGELELLRRMLGDDVNGNEDEAYQEEEDEEEEEGSSGKGAIELCLPWLDVPTGHEKSLSAADVSGSTSAVAALCFPTYANEEEAVAASRLLVALRLALSLGAAKAHRRGGGGVAEHYRVAAVSHYAGQAKTVQKQMKAELEALGDGLSDALERVHCAIDTVEGE